MVIELFRFGIRAPSVNWYDNRWGDQVGQLTAAGMRQHYTLGKVVAEQYPHLANKYDPQKVYIRSTNFNVSLQSAQAHLAGLYSIDTQYGELTDNQQGNAVPPYKY